MKSVLFGTNLKSKQRLACFLQLRLHRRVKTTYDKNDPESFVQ